MAESIDEKTENAAQHLTQSEYVYLVFSNISKKKIQPSEQLYFYDALKLSSMDGIKQFKRKLLNRFTSFRIMTIDQLARDAYELGLDKSEDDCKLLIPKIVNFQLNYTQTGRYLRIVKWTEDKDTYIVEAGKSYELGSF